MIHKLLLLAFFLLPTQAFPAEMITDPDFNPQIEWKPGSYRFLTMHRQPDGKILLAGSFERLNGSPFKGIARINKNGSTDTTFNPALEIRGVNHIEIGADNNIYLAGWFSHQNRTSHVAKVAFDGTVDADFHGGGNYNGYFAVTQDGSIIFTGDFTSLVGGSSPYLAKLLPNGSLDRSFLPPTQSDMALSVHYATIHLLPEGKFIAAGFMGVTNNNVYNIHRFNLDGSLDSSFHASAEVAGRIRQSYLLQNGKIVVSTTQDNGLRKLNADGTLDFTFKQRAPFQTDYQPIRFAVAPDGRIICVVTTGTQAGGTRLLRLMPDGSIDESFGSGGPSDWVGDFPLHPALLVETNGDILVGGAFTKFNGRASGGLERVKGGLLATIVRNEIKDGDLRLTLVGNQGSRMAIDGSSDLKNWSQFKETFLEGNEAEISVELGANSHFYRAR